jgi:hypothetical protein
MVSTGHRGVNKDVRSINQTATPQFKDIPSFPDDLEAIVASIECRLMETLTPRQFAMVQHLVEASKILTEAELTLGRDLAAARMSA